MSTRKKTDIKSLEQAYELISRELMAFVDGRPWDVAGGRYQVTPDSVGATWWRNEKGIQDETGPHPPREVSYAASDSVWYLRDSLLETTGQRIWGLTFTLYPDGKFNVEYDYNKPEDYEEDLPHQAFLGQCMSELRTKTDEASAAWGLGTEARWDVDLAAGILRFEFAEETHVRVPVQVVGTYDQNDGSFLWGWDHPSVPPELRRAAEAVREYGAAHGIDSFVQRKVACSEDQAWEFAAAAAHLDDAAGAYRGPSGSTLVFMTFAAPN